MKRIAKAFVSLLICSAMAFSFVACSSGDDGKDGVDGKDGTNGTSVIWKGSFSSSDDPELENPEYLWAYYDTTDECSYVWDGTEWTIMSGKMEKTFEVQIEELTEKDVAVRGLSNGAVADTGELIFGFMDGKEDIPYIPLEFVTQILNGVYGSDDENAADQYEFSEITEDTTEVTITNTKNSSKVVIDLTKHRCAFDNYDAFFQDSESKIYRDLAATKNSDAILKITDFSNIAGQPIGLDWSTQDIELCLWNLLNEDTGEYECTLAIPLQTFNDIFLSCLGSSVIYNGKYAYWTHNLSGDVLTDYYETSPWKDASGKRSEALAEFCYNELCMNLDFNYGLKEIHGIEKFEDFDNYFYAVGLSDKLSSTDASEFATAVKDLCEFYFGDGHSNYMTNSPFLGASFEVTGTQTDVMNRNYSENYRRYALARNAKIGSGSTSTVEPVPCYTVSADGKTAIVRFDEFTYNGWDAESIRTSTGFDTIKDTYVHQHENLCDTIALIHFLNEKIQADNNIENVVLDLSCNGGGACVSATYILSWMLGKTTINITNPLSGAKWTATYTADVNLDGTFGGDDDSIKDKNLFCLVSPLSFSCGNFVPAVLKASDRVTILGVTSGGGTAAVQNASTADGTIFRMSSRYVMSVFKNGSNYDIDKGVDPHYYINKPENFYDTAKISALVNSINETELGSGSGN